MSAVSIGIAGTPDVLSGFLPLIDIDSPLDLTVDHPFDEAVEGDYVIELRHTAEFISLRYFARPDTVHGFQSDRPGRLWIGMTIPKGKRFANAVSPYTVLMAVWTTFRQNFMSVRSDITYEFNPGPYYRAPFDELLDRYPLEDFPGRYIEMNGDIQAVVRPLDEDAMSRFFADTQYPEFDRFSSVLVAPGHPKDGSIQVEIPRPIYFDVYCSGKRYAVLSSPEQRFERTLFPSDSVHDPVNVSFTLSELRKGAYESWVKVDEAKEEVHLYPVFPERSFRLDFEFRSSTGDLDDIPCDLVRFYLSAGKKIKTFQFDGQEGRAYVQFEGMEADELWKVCYRGNPDALRFHADVTDISPKDETLVFVTLTPSTGLQGIEMSAGTGGLPKLVVENHKIELRATIKAVFSDDTTLYWGRVILDRQAGGEEKAFILPPPYGTKKKLKQVILSRLRDRDDHAYMDLVFSAYPASGELPLKKLDTAEGYKIVIDSIARPSIWENVKEWMNNRFLRNWGFIVGFLLALAIGAGSGIAWKRNIDEKKPIPPIIQQGGQVDNEELINQGENDGDIGEEVSPVVNAYIPSYEDAQKIGLYYDLMTKLENSVGQPLTFSQVVEIDEWQKKIYADAREHNQVVDINQLKFIHKYIPYFSLAVDEIERIKNGVYRDKGWDEKAYYDNCLELSRVNSLCLPDDANVKEALKKFRVAIQNLYFIWDEDFNDDTKKRFIRRAILSNAYRDKQILADVNSFKGIMDKYNMDY